jgi:hypothetical protein
MILRHYTPYHSYTSPAATNVADPTANNNEVTHDVPLAIEAAALISNVITVLNIESPLTSRGSLRRSAARQIPGICPILQTHTQLNQ